MPDKGTKFIEDLKEDLQTAGYHLVMIGTKLRVTHPHNGKMAFLPIRAPKNSDKASIQRSLENIGWDPQQAKDAQEKRKRAAIEADRVRNARAMRDAELAETLRQQQRDAFHVRTANLPESLPAVANDVVKRPRTDLMMITPQFAAELLTANRFFNEGALNQPVGVNRKFRIEQARTWSTAMLRGEWVETHQGVGFDVNGVLLDGQHRLFAVVLAGRENPDIEVPMMVTYDLPPEAAAKMDMGLKRTTADQLAMLGFKLSTNLAGTARMVHVFDNVPYAGPTSWRDAAPTVDQILEMVEAEPFLLDSNRAGARLAKIGKPTALGAAVHVIARATGADDPRVKELVDSLVTGAIADARDPRLVLRNQLLRLRSDRKAQSGRAEQMALVIKAWNLYIDGEKRSLLSWRSTEPFPVPATPKETPTAP